MSRDLKNRTIVITGASSGIGAATALACARAGMDLLLNGRDAARLGAVADQIRQLGRRVQVVAADVTQPGLSGRLLDIADETLDGFYAVFANAGYGFKRPSHETSAQELRRIFEVNFFSACDLVTEAARRLLARGERGHLLMCSSAVAKFTLPSFAAYSATKAAQNHFCRAMRMELRPHGIEVASVHPVTTATGFFVRAAAESGSAAAARGPGPFVQRPERVARAVVRCLRRPRPEVWTSFPARLAAGLVTVFPSLLDLLARRL
ncbi:MAG: SDR family NAD(P)-dependent oxidoreductase [Planctomycetota bacterium]